MSVGPSDAMRRPDLKVFLKPAIAVAGAEVVAEAVLVSRGKTSISGMTMTLRGTERVAFGKSGAERSIVAQRATFGARTLEKGEHRVAARFPIPHDAPPSHRGYLIAIEYELDVHVEIPWWLDRRERYVVPVTRRATERTPAAPKVFCNRQEGADGLYLEATLDDLTIEQAGTVAGAVSFVNVARARIKRVDLEFQRIELVSVGGNVMFGPTTTATFVSTIVDGAPREGETTRFHVALPADAASSFSTVNARVSWKVAVVAVTSFGRDVRLEIPITVVPAARTNAKRRRRAQLPPVGRERRTLLFRAAAEQLDLELDATSEEMRGTFGASSGTVRLESREGVGLLAVIELAWPSLDLGLEVRERKWTDAFGDEMSIDDPSFRKRFRVNAREPERVSPVVADDVRPALVALAEVEIDDEGALLARPTSVQSVEALIADLKPALDAARLLGDAVARIERPTIAPYR